MVPPPDPIPNADAPTPPVVAGGCCTTHRSRKISSTSTTTSATSSSSSSSSRRGVGGGSSGSTCNRGGVRSRSGSRSCSIRSRGSRSVMCVPVQDHFIRGC